MPLCCRGCGGSISQKYIYAAAVMAVVVCDGIEIIIWWVSDNVDLPVEAEIETTMRLFHAAGCLLCARCRCNLESQRSK